MKIKLIFLLLLQLSLKGQPVLQESNFAAIGFTTSLYTMSNSIFPGPGSGGPNQTWNFSSVPVFHFANSAVSNPSVSNCYSLYVGANYAVIEPNHIFYSRSANKLELMGFTNSTCSFWPSVFSDFQQELKFPFNYMDTYSDTYTVTTSNTSSGTVTVTYDGYGTLVTPFETINNVIRIERIDKYGSNPGTYTYNWYTSGNPSYRVMTSSYNSCSFWVMPGVGINESIALKNVKIYPNPNTEKILNVNFEYTNSDYELEITNLIGKSQLKSILISKENKVDVSDLKAGIYFYSLKKENRVFKTGKLVIE